MGLFDNYKLKKSIETFLSLKSPNSPEMTQVVTRLQQIGPPAVPRLLEALDTARNRDSVVTLLVTFVDDDTFPLFLTALSDPSPRVVEGVLEILSRADTSDPSIIPQLLEAFDIVRNRDSVVTLLVTFVDNDTLPLFLTALSNASPRVVAGILEVLGRVDTYDPNRLLGLFVSPTLSSAELEKLFLRRASLLQPHALLRALTTASSDNYATIFQCLEHVATEAIIPELIPHLRASDWTVRFAIARTLCRFRTSTVRDTLTQLLVDPQRQIRALALEGLAPMYTRIDARPVCRLLCDSDPGVRGKATHMLLRMVLDESEENRQRAVQGLQTVGSISAIKHVLVTLKRKEWWEAVRVTDALSTHSGQQLLEAIVALLQDQDGFIRRCAGEIILTLKDERARGVLVGALQDTKTRDRTVEALAALGDKRVVTMFIRMLAQDVDVCLIAIRALVACKEPQAIRPLLVQLQHPHKVVRQEVLGALAVLTNAEYASDVLQAMMAMRDSADEGIKELANRMATTLIKRFGSMVMPRREAMEMVKPRAQPAAARAASPAKAAGARASSQHHPGAGTTVIAQETEMPIDVTRLEPGVVLADRYRVKRRVGQGGFSTVFLVEDVALREEVILKILNSQIALGENVIKRFIQEWRYARKVTHSNVIRIHDFITLGKSYAISMEYFPGHTLADELLAGTPLSPKRGLKIIWDVCRGIGAAHQVDIVHRDLKPLNILINDQGLAKVVDFGVATLTSHMGNRLTKVGTLVGTPAYVAPEQVQSRNIDARTDIYSLGVVMYEVFAGRHPYGADGMSILFQHVAGDLVPPCQVNPRLAPVLEQIIMKAMAVDPDRRYQDMHELRRSLVEFSRQYKS